jgi:membrane protein implicated in regulation of membrane protease activity
VVGALTGLAIDSLVNGIYLAIVTDAAAVEVATVSAMASPVWIGTLASLFSAILMAMLMITYHMNPDRPPKRR